MDSNTELKYKSYLNKLTVADLKTFIKSYITHVKIQHTGRKKADMINDILMHTYYNFENDSIYAKTVKLDVPKKTLSKREINERKKLNEFIVEMNNEYGTNQQLFDI